MTQSTSASETYTVTGTTVTRTGTFGGLTYSGVGFLTLNAGTSSTNLINVNKYAQRDHDEPSMATAAAPPSTSTAPAPAAR